MRDIAHSIYLIKLNQITMRKKFDLLFLTTLKVYLRGYQLWACAMPLIQQKYVLIDSTHFAKSSDSEIFELSENSEFSISPEKVISRQPLIPKIRQTGPLIMCRKRLMYSYCTGQIWWLSSAGNLICRPLIIITGHDCFYQIKSQRYTHLVYLCTFGPFETHRLEHELVPFAVR